MNFNIGMLIFTLIFFYLIFTVYSYMTKEKIQFYEVADGSIVDDKSYTGIILRQETTQYADSAGAINYYVREGKRAAVGTNIYSIDERGTLSALMEEQNKGVGALTDRDISDLRKLINSYSVSYSDETFDDVYNTRYALEAMCLEYVNFNTLENQGQMTQEMGNDFRQITAPVSGVVSYGIDNYEALDSSQVNEAVFDRSQYTRAITRAGQWVEPGTPIYKVITDDNWSVVFQVTEEDAVLFGSQTTLQVSFPSQNLTAKGTFSLITGNDGKAYGKLDFDKYMVQFVSDRYVDFEIMTSTTEGLKIPISSVTTKNFFLIPVDFVAKGGDGLEDGFNKEVYSEAGTSVVFVPTTIYYGNDEYYYIDCEDEGSIQAGDYLVRPDSSERFQVGITASLQGVYNINKGYTVFRQIEVLAQSDEFYTIRKNMSYGLSVYDHIVLNASIIEDEGMLIYQ
ncbi:MAG: HlyD family efflux transporter periplasmic adaptor subunit [Hungatella sp.]|nr:HlyD family efflux transporter periplasmic adaptor subunit [Hungatella sp.]